MKAIECGVSSIATISKREISIAKRRGEDAGAMQIDNSLLSSPSRLRANKKDMYVDKGYPSGVRVQDYVDLELDSKPEKAFLLVIVTTSKRGFR